MTRNILISTALAGALFAFASPASAANFFFTSDGIDLAFVLPDSPTPILGVPGEGFVVVASGTLNGNPFSSGGVTFLNTAYDLNPSIPGGGFSYDGSATHLFSGAQLYSGSEFAPLFIAGTYTLTEYGTGTVGTLVISDVGGAVPEPVTWAMMVGGFGLVGGAMRRRSTTVTYA